MKRKVLDRQLALDLRDIAIARVDEGANEEWKAEAMAAVERTCRKLTEFTVDAIQEEMRDAKVETHEGRAMGAIVIQAVRNGWMVRSGVVIKSAQPQCHGNLRTVWRSLLKL